VKKKWYVLYTTLVELGPFETRREAREAKKRYPLEPERYPVNRVIPPGPEIVDRFVVLDSVQHPK
jgi:hypothetical protein